MLHRRCIVVRIPFSLAIRTQIEDILLPMYGVHTLEARNLVLANLSKPKNLNTRASDDKVDGDDAEDLLFEQSVAHTLDEPTLRRLAREFADKLPEGRFTPAAIQGYLLTRK
ncbi:hypothetical protein C7974DRAFT_409945 [Boeremia exigua]|uniref:uncharacterized protein n=1 Tax=Boeremia exigua TaxID=749465 RepID=UPI001E8D5543|nr:uncharacterized protein C7974DRAFT_409945 [Boeremia exigua]KAH6638945.1 hypothetical protein C7974DRAFT_409945 [Boeremia exigua]